MQSDIILRFYNGTILFMNQDEYEKNKKEIVVSGKTGDQKAEIPEGYAFKEHYWTHDVYVKE